MEPKGIHIRSPDKARHHFCATLSVGAGPINSRASIATVLSMKLYIREPLAVSSKCSFSPRQSGRCSRRDSNSATAPCVALTSYLPSGRLPNKWGGALLFSPLYSSRANRVGEVQARRGASRMLRVRRQGKDALSENLLRQALSEGTGWVCRRRVLGQNGFGDFCRNKSHPRTGPAPR